MMFKIEWWVLIKGMLMGAADIVPGVSGGTVAFITGIYERLLNALKSIVPEFIALLKHKKFSLFIHNTQLFFLMTLFIGIVMSVVSLANGITYLMQHYPIPLWSGFFGLIMGSVYIIARDISVWSVAVLVSLLVGILLAAGITQLAPAELEKNNLTIFISGVLAICAMVLPGISGSFILVILGSYAWVLDAVKQFEWLTLGLFCSGCFVGLLSIANVLSWAFTRYRELTLALLTGFMLGALIKVWPWKEVISYRLNSQGEQVPLVEKVLMPDTYQSLTGQDAQLTFAILSCFIMAIFVIGLSVYMNGSKKKRG